MTAMWWKTIALILLAWALFVSVLLAVRLCLNVILRPFDVLRINSGEESRLRKSQKKYEMLRVAQHDIHRVVRIRTQSLSKGRIKSLSL